MSDVVSLEAFLQNDEDNGDEENVSKFNEYGCEEKENFCENTTTRRVQAKLNTEDKDEIEHGCHVGANTHAPAPAYEEVETSNSINFVNRERATSFRFGETSTISSLHPNDHYEGSQLSSLMSPFYLEPLKTISCIETEYNRLVSSTILKAAADLSTDDGETKWTRRVVTRALQDTLEELFLDATIAAKIKSSTLKKLNVRLKKT